MVDVSRGRLFDGELSLVSARSMIVPDDMCCGLVMVDGDVLNVFIIFVTVGVWVIGEDMFVLSVEM